jgi:hypothetical protein
LYQIVWGRAASTPPRIDMHRRGMAPPRIDTHRRGMAPPRIGVAW